MAEKQTKQNGDHRADQTRPNVWFPRILVLLLEKSHVLPSWNWIWRGFRKFVYGIIKFGTRTESKKSISRPFECRVWKWNNEMRFHRPIHERPFRIDCFLRFTRPNKNSQNKTTNNLKGKTETWTCRKEKVNLWFFFPFRITRKHTDTNTAFLFLFFFQWIYIKKKKKNNFKKRTWWWNCSPWRQRLVLLQNTGGQDGEFLQVIPRRSLAGDGKRKETKENPVKWNTHTHTHTKKNKSKTINVTKRSEDENGVSRGKKKCSFFLLKKNREKESDRTWIVGRAVHFPSFSPRVAIVKMFFFLRIFCRFSFQLKSDLNKFTWPSSGSQRVLALDFDLSLALGRAISFPPFPTWP